MDIALKKILSIIALLGLLIIQWSIIFYVIYLAITGYLYEAVLIIMLSFIIFKLTDNAST